MRFGVLPALPNLGSEPGRGRWARRRGERGSVSIEAALILPVLALLCFGIIEWSLVLRDQVEVTSLARAGARSASAMPPEHPWTVPPIPFTTQVVESVERAGSSLPRGSVRYILVYKAGPDGRPLSGSFDCSAADTTCDRYNWDPTANAGAGGFQRTAGIQWTGSDINACQGEANMTNVGVYVAADHRMLTGLFGASKRLTSYTVMRFEPQKPGRCKE